MSQDGKQDEPHIHPDAPDPEATVDAVDHKGAVHPAPPAPPADDGPSVYEASQWRLMYRRFKKHRMAFWMAHVVILIYVVCLLCAFFSPYDPNTMHKHYVNLPPQALHFGFVEDGTLPQLYVHPYEREQDPVTLRRVYTLNEEVRVPVDFFVSGREWHFLGLIPTNLHFFGPEGGTAFLLGTDRLGRDVFSRILYGGRISLILGLNGVLISFFLGIILGGISGFYGGVLDLVIQRVVEVFQTVPKIPIWLAMAAAMPKNWTSLQVYFAMTLILACMGWTDLCRVVRGKILSLREEDYAKAAMIAGASESRIMFVHLVPNFFSHIIASLTLAIPGMILAETALSFLGLGLRPPIVSWGVLLEGVNVDAILNQPWLLLPGGMVIIAVLAINFTGDGLRDAADPYAN